MKQYLTEEKKNYRSYVTYYGNEFLKHNDNARIITTAGPIPAIECYWSNKFPNATVIAVDKADKAYQLGKAFVENYAENDNIVYLHANITRFTRFHHDIVVYDSMHNMGQRLLNTTNKIINNCCHYHKKTRIMVTFSYNIRVNLAESLTGFKRLLKRKGTRKALKFLWNQWLSQYGKVTDVDFFSYKPKYYVAVNDLVKE